MTGRPDRPKAILVDLDGTLALRGDRAPHNYALVAQDLPSLPVIELVERLADSGLKVIVISGRPEKVRDASSRWLGRHVSAPIEALLLRPNNDSRADEVVKQEIWETSIESSFDVLWVFDDRDKVVRRWRSLGLTCLQVASGDF